MLRDRGNRSRLLCRVMNVHPNHKPVLGRCMAHSKVIADTRKSTKMCLDPLRGKLILSFQLPQPPPDQCEIG
jgi:hypothetical protein